MLVKLFVLYSVLALTSPTSKRVLPRNSVQDQRNYNNRTFFDLPVKEDLAIYLQSTRGLINFVVQNMYMIDFNLAFGIFLINVNLKSAIMQREKTLPMNVVKSIKEITQKADDILKLLQELMAKNVRGQTIAHYISFLFINETKWIERLEKFDSVMLRTAHKHKTVDQIKDTRNKWQWESNEKYIKLINNPVLPNPNQSDTCMALLTLNHISVHNNVTICKLSDTCLNILVNGTDYGYALTHRLLLLLMARYARGCYIFSPRRDRQLTTRYCAIAYKETEYIAQHDFPAVDLFMEQILSCMLDGHLEFLLRSWIAQGLKRQMQLGCFVDVPGDLSTRASTFIDSEKPLDSKSCHIHFTATAGAAISAAAKYVLQNLF